MSLTFRQMMHHTEERLAASALCFGHGFIDAHDEAVELVLAAAGLAADTDALILDQPFPAEQCERWKQWLARRCNDREPLPYITGRAFLGPLEFYCDSRALVPRSPLAEPVLNRLQPWLQVESVSTVVDVCCGGGSLGLLAATVFPDAQVLLTDIDATALSLARENIRRQDADHRVWVCLADLLTAVAPRPVDVVLANPPYVDAEDMAALPAEYHHEPRHALAAGEDGLDLVRQLFSQAAQVLSEHGILLLEVGNSWLHLEAAYPRHPFLWLELESGGHGVCVLTRDDCERLSAASRV